MHHYNSLPARVQWERRKSYSNSTAPDLLNLRSSLRQNVGKIFGIFLDGVPISEPVIQESIPDGTAVISGGFTAAQARDLARNLNEGALPVPITLLSTETISGTLGGAAVQNGIIAGLCGASGSSCFS